MFVGRYVVGITDDAQKRVARSSLNLGVIHVYVIMLLSSAPLGNGQTMFSFRDTLIVEFTTASESRIIDTIPKPVVEGNARQVLLMLCILHPTVSCKNYTCDSHIRIE